MGVEVFETQDALLEAHPKALWPEYGPILKYQDGKYVQVYLGQHEWWIIRLDDPNKVYWDIGYDGDTFGYGYIPLAAQGRPEDWDTRKGAPQRNGSFDKPITFDDVLFAGREKLDAYLDPEGLENMQQDFGVEE